MDSNTLYLDSLMGLSGLSGLTNPTVNGLEVVQGSPLPFEQLTGSVLGQGTTTSSANTAQRAPTQAAPAPAPKPKPVLNRAAVDNTQRSIDELAGILQRALDADRQAYDNANASFNTQQQQEQGRYDAGTVTNQQNYDRNLMASLRSGAKGLGGLLSILRGTGAEGWAKDVVRDTTNSDIMTGLDTQRENQTGLDSSLNSVLASLKEKRRNNDDTLRNNEYAARGNYATQAQKLYTDMAGYYSDAEQNDEATRLMGKAGEYTPEIAKYSTAPVGKFDTSLAEVKAPPITAFSGATKQNVGYDPGNTGSTAGIFTIGDIRKRLAGAGA